MLLLKDSALDAGDIVFVVSHKNDMASRIKRFIQSFTNQSSKHGHREVISTFVCTERIDAGVICHNHEGQINPSIVKLKRNLKTQAKHTLLSRLHDCLSISDSMLIKVLDDSAETLCPQLLQKLNQSIEQNPDKRKHDLIKAYFAKAKKSEIVKFLCHMMQVTGIQQTLVSTNSSLIVFKFNDIAKREQFLAKYRQQQAVTVRYKERNKNRTSTWKLFFSLFLSTKQDERDRNPAHQPSDETYCSRNIIEILNQVDPDLVLRGRNTKPKALEAGMRAATIIDTPTEVMPEISDDMTLEQLLALDVSPIPQAAFRYTILPKEGKALLAVLLYQLTTQVKRIENKSFINKRDREKAQAIRRLITTYQAKVYPSRNNTVLQVEYSLELLAQAMPLLAKPKYRWQRIFSWLFMPRSYNHIREYARTQGIFDYDVRLAQQKFADNNAQEISTVDSSADDSEEKSETNSLFSNEIEQNIFIFADWSVSTWSDIKRQQVVHFIQQQITHKDCQFYVILKGKLCAFSAEELVAQINPQSLDEIIASDIGSNISVLNVISLAEIVESDEEYCLMDYTFCQQFAQKTEFEQDLEKAAAIMALRYHPRDILQAKLAIIDSEISCGDDTTQLQQLRQQILSEQEQKEVHRSGVDNFSSAPPKVIKNDVFHCLTTNKTNFKTGYFRRQVYSDVTVSIQPSSRYDYFSLTGSDAQQLIAVEINRPEKLTNSLKRDRVCASDCRIIVARKILCLTNKFQALPSLHPDEMLTDLTAKGVKPTEYEIKYCPKNDLYFMRLLSDEKKSVEVNYLLQMPPNYCANPLLNSLSLYKHDLPFSNLILKYFNFNQDEAQLDYQCAKNQVQSGEDYLSQVDELKIGSCRLRAIAFKQAMASQFPNIPVRINLNQSHAFVEIKYQGNWQTYCLRGYSNTPRLDKAVMTSLQSSLRCRFYKRSAQPSPPVDAKPSFAHSAG